MIVILFHAGFVLVSDSVLEANEANTILQRKADEDERRVAFAPLPGKQAEVPPIIGSERGVSMNAVQDIPPWYLCFAETTARSQSVCLSICLSVYLSVYLFSCLFVSVASFLPVFLSVCMSVSLYVVLST